MKNFKVNGRPELAGSLDQNFDNGKSPGSPRVKTMQATQELPNVNSTVSLEGQKPGPQIQPQYNSSTANLPKTFKSIEDGFSSSICENNLRRF